MHEIVRRLLKLTLAGVAGTGVLTLAVPSMPAAAQESRPPHLAVEPALASCPAASPRALLAGDSWARYMWDDGSHNDILDKFGHADKLMISRSLADDPGPGHTGPEYAVSGSEARQWVDTANYPWIANMVADLQANPTIDTVVLSIGGNDVLAGRSGGGWYQDMDQDVPGSEAALFDRVETDTWTVIDAALGVRPEIEVVIASYDYPNFSVDPLFCWLYACPKRRDLSYGETSSLITDGEINQLMVDVEGIRIGWANANERVHFDNGVGLMHYFYGDGISGPGVLSYPGQSPPDYEPFPGGNPQQPTLRENFREPWDPIHLDFDGYQYKITNEVESYFFPKYRGQPATTFFSQGGNADGWSDGINLGTDAIIMGDNGSAPYYGILSFDTSSLPQDATVTGASLYMIRSSQQGDNPFVSNLLGTPRIDIVRGTFGAPEVEIDDATAPADATDAGCFDGSAVSDFYAVRVDFAAAGLNSINPDGLTQLRVYFPNADANIDTIQFHDGDGVLLSATDRLITRTKVVEGELEDGTTKVVTQTAVSIVHQGLADLMGTSAPFLDVSYCTAPATVQVGISLANDQVTLEWQAAAGADRYEVWSNGDDPYFTPGENCEAASNCTLTTETVFYPENGVGDAGLNFSYLVRAANDCGGGAISAASNRTAEFDYQVVPGS